MFCQRFKDWPAGGCCRTPVNYHPGAPPAIIIPAHQTCVRKQPAKNKNNT
ncbi:MAG: hypothetical protein V1701_07810 [Planctomycetota bacterium]